MDLMEQAQRQAKAILGIGVPKRVFVCSPLRGDYEANTERARRFCRMVMAAGHVPYAPHLLFPQFMDDTKPKEREIGILMGLFELAKCDELWAFIPATGPSEGMAQEIAYAEQLGIPVIRIPTDVTHP